MGWPMGIPGMEVGTIPGMEVDAIMLPRLFLPGVPALDALGWEELSGVLV